MTSFEKSLSSGNRAKNIGWDLELGKVDSFVLFFNHLIVRNSTGCFMLKKITSLRMCDANNMSKLGIEACLQE